VLQLLLMLNLVAYKVLIFRATALT